ncbi:MAG: winged helix-turn-helix domain-containing protein [Myxococcota bacterium]
MNIPLRDGRVRIDDALVERGGRAASLTPIEQRLLRYLAERAGRICGRDELLTEVWGYRQGVVTRTIDTTVRRLREKIEVDPADPAHLHSVYGRGLRLVPAELADPGPDASLVGREREVAALLVAMRTGVGWLEVVGPPGSGRSRLAAELMRRAGGRLARRVDLRATRTAAGLDARLSNTFRVTPVTAEQIGRALAASGPLVAVLDGADAVGETLRTRIEAWTAQAPALVVVTVSERPLGGPEAGRVTLGPLDPAAARALHLACHGRPPPRDAPALPLAVELGGDAPDLDAAIERVWDGLPSTTAAAARGLATFCGPVGLDDVEGLLGPDALVEAQALAERRLLRVDDEVLELHDAVRGWVWRARTPEPEWIERHGAWFARLGDGGWAPQRLHQQRAAAAELEAAAERCAEPSTRSRCLAALVELFAEEALPAARDEALARLRALPSLGSAERSTLARVAAIARTDSGGAVEALAELDAALAGAASAEERWRLRLARLVVGRAVPDRVPLLVEAEALVREPLPDWLACRAALAHAFVRFSQNLDSEAELLRARALARGVGDVTTDSIACDVLSHLLLRQGRTAESAALAAAALASPTAPRNELHCLVGLAQLELHRGELEAGEAALGRAELMARIHGEPSDQLQLWRLRAVAHALRGEFGEAEEVLLGIGQAADHPGLAAVWNTLADVRLLAGKLEGAREAHGRALERAAAYSQPRFAAQRRSLSAVFALIDRRFDAARTEAREISDQLEPFPRTVHDAQFAYAEAYWGDPGRARELLTSVRERAAEFELRPRSGVELWASRADDRLGSRSGHPRQ